MKPTLRRMLMGTCLLGLTWWIPVAHARREMLLDVTHGQQPSDTGGDKIFFNIEDCKVLGGPALKVEFPTDDSFGDRVAKVTNWRPFTQVEFIIFNPSSEPVMLGFNVKHPRSTDYHTRMDIPLRIAPGRNDLKLAIRSLTNVNGSAPDLDKIVRWHLANQAEKPVTLFFGNICLADDDPSAPVAPSAPAAPAGNLLSPGVVYRVKGTIGDQPLDVTITAETTAAPAPVAVSPPPTAPISSPAHSPATRATQMPELHAPVLFNTPEADAILSALEVYPPDNPWNQVVTDWPVHPNSRNLIASIGADRPLRSNPDMAFVMVPPEQKRMPVKLIDYPDESDRGPFPVPNNVPIEGWPVSFQSDARLKHLSLNDVQRDTANLGGDRHAIVVDPISRVLH